MTSFMSGLGFVKLGGSVGGDKCDWMHPMSLIRVNAGDIWEALCLCVNYRWAQTVTVMLYVFRANALRHYTKTNIFSSCCICVDFLVFSISCFIQYLAWYFNDTHAHKMIGFVAPHGTSGLQLLKIHYKTALKSDHWSLSYTHTPVTAHQLNSL